QPASRPRLARRPVPSAPALVGFAEQRSSRSEVRLGVSSKAPCGPRRACRGRLRYAATYGPQPSPSLVRRSLRASLRPALKLPAPHCELREGIRRKVFGFRNLALHALGCMVERHAGELHGLAVILPRVV